MNDDIAPAAPPATRDALGTDSDACIAHGPALTRAFLRDGLPHTLRRLGLPIPDRAKASTFHQALRRHLTGLPQGAGPARVTRHVLHPIAAVLGAGAPTRSDPVATREGTDDGGHRLGTLRAWAVATRDDLDGRTRASPTRLAHRVLRVRRERLGLLTNGVTLRLLISDPSLPDSHLMFPLDAWRDAPDVPASLRLFLTLLSEPAREAMPAILDAARLFQTRVTDDLRSQAKAGLERFLHAVSLRALTESRFPMPPAEALWHDGLVLIHRLLFVLKLEAATDPARGFSFAATRPWRDTMSPNTALGPLARRHLDRGHDTGSMLETGLRQLFRACREGLVGAELVIAPLGGALFDTAAMPVLEHLPWGETAVAHLLDHLLWTSPANGPRERIHYGTLDVEVLGAVYESLLDLQPAIAAAPTAQDSRRSRQRAETAPVSPDGPPPIPAGTFFLRPGVERKASGSYYTPAPFVRFLVRETLSAPVARHSGPDDPDPGAILALRVLDPATGSGHFLVEACRFLADALLSACQHCHRLAAGGGPQAARFRARLDALPDPDGLLLSYLGRDGLSWSRALALCRRMVAMHCLYGVDRNGLAMELAKLSLWLESHAEGLPLTFLDHRLLVGDSLSGPFLDDLASLPVGGGPLDRLLSRGLAERLSALHAGTLIELRRIGASLGRDLGDLARKQAARDRLAAAQAPLLNLACAWSGAAMLADRAGDDEFQALARSVADTGAWPASLTQRQLAMVEAGRAALPWDLAFPEVEGFDAVIGNPPWDVIQHNARDFLANLAPDPVPTRLARSAIEDRLRSDPAIAQAYAAYRTGFEHRKRLANRLFHHQRVGTEAGATAGNLDAFRLFAERAIRLAGPEGAVGLLLPSAFHANDGATGIRRLFLENGLDTCLSFENRAGLFDIDSRFKFALVVARRPAQVAETIRCAFYLRDLREASDPARVMTYDRAFLRQAGGPRLTFPELRGPADLAIARRMFAERETLAEWCARHGIRLGRDLHMTDDAHRFTPIGTATDPGWLVLHEGKTFHQFTDRRDPAPRHAVHATSLGDKPAVLAATFHFRLVFRDIARSNDERSMIATILPPGTVTGHTATIEKTPEARALPAALTLCAIFNSFAFDWLVRQKTATHLSLYLLDGLPMPTLTQATRHALARAAAALCASDARFAALVAAAAERPALPDPEDRRALRAWIDARIAHAYGLTRPDYAHLLRGFSHKSWPEAPSRCLAAFDRPDDAEFPVPVPDMLVETGACMMASHAPTVASSPMASWADG